jgi:hypothetical protein
MRMDRGNSAKVLSGPHIASQGYLRGRAAQVQIARPAHELRCEGNSRWEMPVRVSFLFERREGSHPMSLERALQAVAPCSSRQGHPCFQGASESCTQDPIPGKFPIDFGKT